MNNKQILESDSLQFTILPSGDIERITFEKNDCIDLYKANSVNGMVFNIYLRLKETGEYTKLLGIHSPSKFQVMPDGVIYEGNFKNIDYSVTLKIIHHTWFYSVSLKNVHEDIEIYYAQDVSLSYFMANEAYSSQYLNHKINIDKSVVTKQNQGRPFSLFQGSFSEIESYSTDAMQFYGKEYKLTNVPKAMKEGCLDNYNYQYEFALITFKVNIKKDEEKKVVFFADFVSDFNKETHKGKEELKSIYNSLTFPYAAPSKKENLKVDFENTYSSLSLSSEELKRFYPEREDEEYDDSGKLISFFSKDSSHIVLKEKEIYLERPSANLSISSGYTKEPEKTFASTNYLYGVFSSHVTLGNTNMNKFISTVRDPLNIEKTTGVRLFVKLNEKYSLLSIPSAYEMRASGSKWIYKIDDDYLFIESVMRFDAPELKIKVESFKKRPYSFLLTNSLIIGPDESVNQINPIYKDNTISYSFSKDNLAGKLESNYSFKIEVSSSDFAFLDYSSLIDEAQDKERMLVVKMDNQSGFLLSYKGIIDNIEPKEISFEEMKKNYENSFKSNIGCFSVSSSDKNVMKFTHLVYWYSHDALIHYASPHGLEQYSGAAWGTRDILQGPVEFFRSMHDYDMVKYLIKRVYSRQFFENHDWPQWFMFDNYSFIEALDSHADIIVWPLKIVGDYINETGDFEILKEIVPYTTREGGVFKGEDTIKAHIENEISTIEKSFIKGTHLPSYGAGDWDDTLQPADKEKAKRMVSPWTSALLIQALSLYSGLTGEYNDLLKSIKKDYKKYLIKDGIVAGFVRFDEDGIKYLLHPEDKETGLKYRLLPITRNFISGFTPLSDKDKYLAIIDKYLMYPDGVRLMDNTVKYHGGSSNIFVRAESAANFGREISLLYVHAHIRYIEAMAKIGEKERVFNALNVINPILIKDNVKNADYRQSCSYFSSSDGCFADRYIANDNIYKLKTQEVMVKGGWRVYSSGPGIYLYELLSNFFGIKELQGRIYIDPMMPSSLNKTTISFILDKKPVKINYYLSGETLKEVKLNGKMIGKVESENPYRNSGISFEKSLLEKENIIDVIFG
ncbi:MAG: hypothetical protein H6687_02390 [Bacillales bacterium]|nr:hypothetical protein [Bacillales bacterium]